jgi:hypothetical protein
MLMPSEEPRQEPLEHENGRPQRSPELHADQGPTPRLVAKVFHVEQWIHRSERL